jgi:hypothetical protein
MRLIGYLAMGGLLVTIMKNISVWDPSCLSIQSSCKTIKLKKVRRPKKTKKKTKVKQIDTWMRFCVCVLCSEALTLSPWPTFSCLGKQPKLANLWLWKWARIRSIFCHRCKWIMSILSRVIRKVTQGGMKPWVWSFFRKFLYLEFVSSSCIKVWFGSWVQLLRHHFSTSRTLRKF